MINYAKIYSQPRENQGENMSKIGKILKIVLIVAIVSVLALLIVNIIKSDHKELESLYRDGEEFDKAYDISSDIRTHSLENDGFSENGGLYAYSLYYIEQAGYIQITVRYNERHMEDIANSYPDFDENKIHYTLKDDKGNTYTPKVLDRAEKYHYQFFKLEFTNVDFTDTTLTLSMVIDVLNDVIGDQNSIVIHESGQTSVPAND